MVKEFAQFILVSMASVWTQVKAEISNCDFQRKRSYTTWKIATIQPSNQYFFLSSFVTYQAKLKKYKIFEDWRNAVFL